MKDKHSRRINYMRISITQSCNYQCVYCKSEETCNTSMLSFDEIIRIAKQAVELGIDKFKITGGEPLVRKDAVSIMKAIKQLPGVKQVTLTTNGSLLNKEMLDAFKEMKLDCINYSIDSLIEDHYTSITKVNKLNHVLEMIDYTNQLNIPCKINAVLYNDTTNQDILSLLDYLKTHQTPIRFIEFMPMKTNDSISYKTKQDVLSLLDTSYKPLERKLGNGPAHYYELEGYKGSLGFIEPIHGKFCHLCNRIRLTSTGYLKACLFHNEGINLKGLDDQKLKEAMYLVIYNKPEAHAFDTSQPGLSMSEIGG